MMESIVLNDITFAIGSAGAGKTHIAVALAADALDIGEIDKIVITRPVIEATDEKLGFLPGSLEEKMDPYLKPITDIFNTIWSYDRGRLETLMGSKRIEVAPLAFMRGRAQPLDAVLKTPKGNILMGSVEIGDTILGSDGKAIQVTGVFPQGIKSVYKITFSDGSCTHASEDHLWVTQTRSEKKHGKGFTTKTTKQIIEAGVRVGHGAKNHEIPMMAGPAIYESEEELSIKPYLLGMMLGDGCMPSTGNVGFISADVQLVDSVRDALPCDMKIMASKIRDYTYTLVKEIRSSAPNPLKEELKKLGLMGCLSYDKFIPQAYKMASPIDRVSLLQGLMDTDGTVWIERQNRARVSYSSTSRQLAEDVVELVQSLGGIASLRTSARRADSRNIHHRRASYVVEMKLPVGICPFRLDRKTQRYTGHNKPRLYRFISQIERVQDQECQCISVSADDKLYLTDHFIVTHNTFKNTWIICDEAQNMTANDVRMLLTRLGEGSKMILTGDPTQRDRKTARGFETAYKLLTGCPGVAFIEFGTKDVVRHKTVENILKRWGPDQQAEAK